MNKVKFNRFEKYIPEPNEDGILTVSLNEENMYYQSIEKLNRQYGRDNLVNGFKLTLNNNVFTVGKGQLFAYTKRAYEFNVNNNIASIKVIEPFWGILSKEQFDIGDYTFNIENHYLNETLCGADYSEMNYNIPPMTSNNYPYGVCKADSIHSNTALAPWKAFNGTTINSDDCYMSYDPSTGLYPLNLYYSISSTNDKFVKPTSFIVQNRNLNNTVRPMLTFLIQASTVLHPYDDLDWETLVNVDNVNIKHNQGSNAVTTYNVSTNKYYRHFRIHCLSVNTTAPSGNSMMTIGEWKINGITKDIIPVLNPIHNYFMIKAKNKETQEIKTGFVSSKNNIPVLDGTFELIDYYPIKNSFMNINDYNDVLYINKTIEDTIDVSTVIIPNSEHRIWIAENNDNYTYIIENNNVLPYNKKCKLIGKFKTDENNTIINYYPHDEISKVFNNRFIIAEQHGTTGYRVYSDGWKEQWGNLVNPIFPIAFDNIPVSVERGATNVTKTGMTIAAGYWTVKGY